MDLRTIRWRYHLLRQPDHQTSLTISRGALECRQRLLSGGQINTVVQVHSGLSLVISGANNSRATRPNNTGVSAKLDNPTADNWFDSRVFVSPPLYALENTGCALPDVTRPAIPNADLSINKPFALIEKTR